MPHYSDSVRQGSDSVRQDSVRHDSDSVRVGSERTNAHCRV